MKALITAVLLTAFVSASVSAAPAEPKAPSHIPLQHVTIDRKMVTAIADRCAEVIALGKAQEAVDELQLRTVDEQKGLFLMCEVYAQGVKDGVDVMSKALQHSPENGPHLPNVGSRIHSDTSS